MPPVLPVPNSWRRLVSAAVHGIRLNSVSAQVRDGRPVMFKTRSRPGTWIARLTNRYFFLARIPIRYRTKTRDCLRRSNSRSQRLGSSMAGTLTPRVLEATAVELRRAHGLRSNDLHAPWSHGDLSVMNILYDDG
jgi:hypothetical protein